MSGGWCVYGGCECVVIVSVWWLCVEWLCVVVVCV